MPDETDLTPTGAEPTRAPEQPGDTAGAGRRPRAPGAYLRLPLWQRFALAGGITAVLLIALVIFVEHNNTNSNPSLNEAAEVRANREAEILVAQDQAPHTVRLQRGAHAAASLEGALHARMASQIRAGVIDGPLKAAECVQRGAASGGRHAFSCTIEAGQVTYPFLGVVDTSTRRIAYCKRDPPPTPSDNVPVSSRCVG
jgi:hypothetical protein